MRLLACLLLFLLPMAASAAAPPTGTWHFDKAALEAVGERVAEAMAVQAGPEQQAHMEAAVRDLEARHARLASTDPAAAKRMEPYLREMQAQNSAMQTEPKAYFKRRFLGSVADLGQAVLELRPGGKVQVTASGDKAGATAGSWKLNGQTIEIAAVLPAGTGDAPQRPIRLRGAVKGKRMDLRLLNPDGGPVSEADPLARVMQNASWVLVRD